MPKTAKKPCTYVGCGVLVEGRVKFCDDHKTQQSNTKTNYNHTKTSAQRGYGYSWQKLRLSVFRRDNGLCQMCKDKGIITESVVVDHIIPKAKGGDDSMDNLQSLCNMCHNYKTSAIDSKG